MSLKTEIKKRASKVKQFGKDFTDMLGDILSYTKRNDINNKYEFENQSMYRKHITRELKKAGAPESYINDKTSQSEVEKALSGKNNKLK